MTGKAGMPWYKEKDYPKLRSLFPGLPEFYDEWLEDAEERQRREIARGVEVVRIFVEPIAFVTWCKIKEFHPDATARKSYVRRGASLGRPPRD